MLAFFFFNDTATTEIYTLSLHDALPIYRPAGRAVVPVRPRPTPPPAGRSHRVSVARGAPDLVEVSLLASLPFLRTRSEEHTSELQSPCNLVCRPLLEKKKLLTFQAISFH